MKVFSTSVFRSEKYFQKLFEGNETMLRARTQIGLQLLFAIPLLALNGAPVRAEFIEPGNVHVTTEAYTIEKFDFPHGLYEYDVTWQGLPVGSAQIQVGEQEVDGRTLYDIEAQARTTRSIDLFYALRHRSESFINRSNLRSVLFESAQTENSRRRDRTVEFSPDGQVKAKLVKEKGPDEDVSFQTSNNILDPLGAALYARSLPLEVGKSFAFDVFNGKHRFLITLTVAERKKIEIDDQEIDAFKVIPEVQKLTDTEGEKRLKSAAIWVSADGKRDILKLESRVLVGSIRATLARFTPSQPEKLTPEQLARLRSLESSARARMATK